MKFFDASAWLGQWPFAFLDAPDARTLAVHLRQHGIDRALVSHLDAVFAPAPDRANATLRRETRRTPSLMPVPIINPTLGNWRDELARCATDSRVRMIRILPNYHAFALGSKVADELAEELLRRGLALAVQMRLIDERHEWHGLNIKPTPTHALDGFLARHRKLPVLAGGLGRLDILALLPKHAHLVADLAFAEWHDTLSYFVNRVGATQLAFCSHAPFHITAASKAKVAAQLASPAAQRAVAAGNLRRQIDKL